MAGGGKSDLVASLRSRLSDDRALVAAFALNVSSNVKLALLEVANGYLIVTLEGSEGPAKPIRFNLSSPVYNTIGKLVAALSRQSGYVVTSSSSIASDHPSTDLRVEGLPNIAGDQAYTLKHRIWSDDELIEFIAEATTIHNPNYTAASVPRAEYPYVLMKAQAHAYRALAADAVRRKGLDMSVDTLMALVKDLEAQYETDRKRMARAIPVPKTDDAKVGSGDAMQGNLTRRSLRAGYTSPYRTASPPTPPRLLQPADDDVEDTTVRLRWAQNRDESFVYNEMWRDTRPEVERSTGGKLASGGEAISGNAGLPQNTQYSRGGTSKQVLGVGMGVQSTPVYDGFSFFTSAELSGSSVVNVTFTDGVIDPTVSLGIVTLGDVLEPDSDYYYRLYSINWNGEIVASEVLKVHTRTLRAKFKRDAATKALANDAITPIVGPLAGGTQITILGTNIIEGCYVEINGKRCTEVSKTSTQIVVTSPAFTNTDFIGKKMDMVLYSPSRLRDIVLRGWSYS